MESTVTEAVAAAAQKAASGIQATPRKTITVGAAYTVTIPAGATRRLLFFNQMNPTNAAAFDAASIFDANSSLGSDLLAGLAPNQLGEVVNWSFGCVFLPLVMRAAGRNIIATDATGCLEVFSSLYPFSAWEVPWVHSLFENSAAVASGVEAALKALELFNAGVAAAPGTPVSDDPLPGAFAYCAFVAWLSLYASEAEFVGALLINLPVWGSNCARMAEALRSKYGLSEAEVAFFTMFATAPPGFEDRATRGVGSQVRGVLNP